MVRMSPPLSVWLPPEMGAGGGCARGGGLPGAGGEDWRDPAPLVSWFLEGAS